MIDEEIGYSRCGGDIWSANVRYDCWTLVNVIVVDFPITMAVAVVIDRTASN